MSKVQKGQLGYRNFFKKTQLFKISILVVFILAQLIGRSFTDNEAVKNVLTVMAIITVLPAANLASPYFASFAYKTISPEFHEKISGYEKDMIILYDLIITTKDAVLPMDAIAVHPTGIYGYCTNQKADPKAAEKAINEILTTHRLDPNMKVIKEEGAFRKRLSTLKPSSEYEDDGSSTYAVNLLKNLSM